MLNSHPPDLEAFEAGAHDLMPGFRAGCPSVQLLRAARLDALPQELQVAVSAHLEVCASCRMLQSDLQSLTADTEATPQETSRILSRVRRGRGAQDVRHGARWVNLFWWSAVSASLALCAALVVWQLRRPTAPPAQVPQPVAARQAEPAPLPPAPRAPVTQQPDALKLEKPAVKLTLAMLTWRGSDGAQRGLAQDIAPALDLYRADRFAEAEARLEVLARKYRDAVEVFFYLGACRLLLGQFPEASAALERAAGLADDTFSADVSWYLGLSYQRSGRQPEARARFSALCGTQNVYRDRACAALKELGR